MSELALKAVEILSPVFLAGLGWLAVRVSQWIAAKTMNEYLKGVMARLSDAVFSAVRELDQTVVEAIKVASADGKITPQEAIQIKAECIANVKSHLGTKGLSELSKIFGLSGSEVDKFLSTKVEAAVQVVRLEKDVAAVQIPQMPRG